MMERWLSNKRGRRYDWRIRLRGRAGLRVYRLGWAVEQPPPLDGLSKVLFSMPMMPASVLACVQVECDRMTLTQAHGGQCAGGCGCPRTT
jgi:hypothetical protein